jgi:hypothetical protein
MHRVKILNLAGEEEYISLEEAIRWDILKGLVGERSLSSLYYLPSCNKWIHKSNTLSERWTHHLPPSVIARLKWQQSLHPITITNYNSFTDYYSDYYSIESTHKYIELNKIGMCSFFEYANLTKQIPAELLAKVEEARQQEKAAVDRALSIAAEIAQPVVVPQSNDDDWIIGTRPTLCECLDLGRSSTKCLDLRAQKGTIELIHVSGYTYKMRVNDPELHKEARRRIGGIRSNDSAGPMQKNDVPVNK